MRPSLVRGVALLALAAGVSCASATGPMVITGFYPLKVTTTACTADTSAQVGEGLLDSSQGTGYMVGVELTNQLADNATAYQTTTDMAYVDSEVLQFHGNNGLPTPPAETVAVSGVIPPSSKLDMVVSLLTSANGTSLQESEGSLLVDVMFKGHYEDGSLWSTASETFPVQVCAGCLKLCASPTATCGLDSLGQADGRTCPSSTGG